MGSKKGFQKVVKISPGAERLHLVPRDLGVPLQHREQHVEGELPRDVVVVVDEFPVENREGDQEEVCRVAIQ